MNNEDKEAILLANGWVKEGSVLFTKQSWLDESVTLNRAPHHCPNWYHYETLDAAYAMHVAETSKSNYPEHVI